MDWNLGRWVACETASVQFDLNIVLNLDDMSSIAIPSSLQIESLDVNDMHAAFTIAHIQRNVPLES